VLHPPPFFPFLSSPPARPAYCAAHCELQRNLGNADLKLPSLSSVFLARFRGHGRSVPVFWPQGLSPKTHANRCFFFFWSLFPPSLPPTRRLCWRFGADFGVPTFSRRHLSLFVRDVIARPDSPPNQGDPSSCLDSVLLNPNPPPRYVV